MAKLRRPRRPARHLTVRQGEIVRAVIRHGGNQSAAARALGITQQRVNAVLHHPGAMAVLTQALTEQGITAEAIAEEIRVLIQESTRPVVVGDGKGVSHIELVPDNQTRVAAVRLVVDVWDRASRQATHASESDERAGDEDLADLTDEELLTALSYSVQRRPR